MIKNYTIYPSKSELIQAAVETIVRTVTHFVKENGRCFLALAGGNTPRDIYATLASYSQEIQIPWEGVHLFWGDERTVPPDHPDSNYGMVRDALLNHVTIPEANVHRIKGEIDPQIAAAEYSQVIRETIPTNPPRLDLVLLGLGGDGHTASLFPGDETLDEQQEDVMAIFVKKLDTWRITLTYPMLNRAREVILLVAGKSKAEIVKRIHTLHEPTKDYPAAIVSPKNGNLHWMLDAEAAESIKFRR